MKRHQKNKESIKESTSENFCFYENLCYENKIIVFQRKNGFGRPMFLLEGNTLHTLSDQQQASIKSLTRTTYNGTWQKKNNIFMLDMNSIAMELIEINPANFIQQTSQSKTVSPKNTSSSTDSFKSTITQKPSIIVTTTSINFAEILTQLSEKPVIHSQPNPVKRTPTTIPNPPNKKHKKNENDPQIQTKADLWVKDIIERAYDHYPKPNSTTSNTAITNISNKDILATSTETQDGNNIPNNP